MSFRSVHWSVNRSLSIPRLLALSAVLPLLISAQQDTARARRYPGNAHPKPAENAAAPPSSAAANQRSARPSSGRLDRFALILSDEPVAKTIRNRRQLQSAAAVQAGRAIVAKQQTLQAELARRNIRTLGATHVVLNAVYVSAPGADPATLQNLPGVQRVVRMHPVHRTLNLALGLVGIPSAWGVVGGEGNAGAGIKIGIIDTGIDVTHPAFQDSSLRPPSGYPLGHGDSWQSYTNNKIIVARSYVDQLVLPFTPGQTTDNSRPDDLSPDDRVGHGTAAAMIAAGETVNAPLAQITGAAPKAFLGNYKIFGSPGVNDITFDDVVLMALEDAFNDGMDIVSLSLGAPAQWGPEDVGTTCGNTGTTPCDPRAAAVENAVQAGLTVVTGAGNDGNTAYNYPAYGSIESPGTAPDAITVGASYNAHVFYASVGAAGKNAPSSLQGLSAFFGGSPKPGGAFSAPMADVTALGGTQNPDACFALPSGSLNGAVALILTDPNCSHATQAINAENAGASAALFYAPSGSEFIYTIEGLGEVGIPVVMIGNTEGTNLLSYLTSNSGAAVTLDPGIVETNASSTENFIASFSGRGPSIETASIKPELVATGTDLYTATQSYDPNGDLYDPSGYTVVQGTSFAAPLVAGAAALVLQAHPGMTPGQLKSAIVNTAVETVNDYDANGNVVPAGVETTGAGLLDAGAAVSNNVAVEPATLSFGQIGKSLPSINITFTNTGTAPVNLNLSVNPFTNDPNAQVALSNANPSIPAGGQVTVTAALQGNLPVSGVYEGDVNVGGAAQTTHIPYLYSVTDGAPANILPLTGLNFLGAAGDPLNGDLLVLVVDQFGLPVPGEPVQFASSFGGGTITSGTGTTGTDNYGIGYAQAQLGPQVGAQQFVANVGNPNPTQFFFNGRVFPLPSINAGGVVNGASFVSGQGLAPGSYISIFGSGLSEVSRLFFTPYLPVSLGGVSVSFDVPSAGISVPGYIVFVDPSQIDVQIPWELAGQSSAVMKVSIGLTSSLNTFTVPLNAYSPAFFEYSSGGQKYLAAQDASYHLIGPSNPARLGATILLYSNGLGPVDHPVPSGQPTPAQAPSTTTVPQVTIGGQSAQVVFSGLSPQSIALYQVNVVVPQNISTGSQPVVMTQNGVSSQISSIVVR